MESTNNTVPKGHFRANVWPRIRNFIGGYFSGMALVIAGHPFDTVKVRLQSQGKGGRFSGPMNCLKMTIQKEGMVGLYKGVTPPLFATGVVNSCLFGLQGLTIHNLKKLKGREGETTTIAEIGQSAVFTGFLISFLVTPMEGIKARLQVQYNHSGDSGAKYKGPIDCIRKVHKEEGLRRGIYRGWVPTAFCRMSNYAYFGTYEWMRRYLSGDSSQKLTLGPSMVAGGSAGVAYWLSCYPMDVIKNRIMAAQDTKHQGVREVAKTIYKENGARGFFVGFSPALLRSVPANAACFLAYEVVMHLLPE